MWRYRQSVHEYLAYILLSLVFIHALMIHASMIHALMIHASMIHALMIHALMIHALRIHALMIHVSIIHVSIIHALLYSRFKYFTSFILLLIYKNHSLFIFKFFLPNSYVQRRFNHSFLFIFLKFLGSKTPIILFVN
jgi:hypothetical protein